MSDYDTFGDLTTIADAIPHVYAHLKPKYALALARTCWHAFHLSLPENLRIKKYIGKFFDALPNCVEDATMYAGGFTGRIDMCNASRSDFKHLIRACRGPVNLVLYNVDDDFLWRDLEFLDDQFDDVEASAYRYRLATGPDQRVEIYFKTLH